MRAEPFLCFGDVELGNANRTLIYLLRGLAGPRFEVFTTPAYLSAGDIYLDEYLDEYVGAAGIVDPFATSGLADYCADYDDGPYVDPATDEAPWYTADVAASADFLGFVPWSVETRPSVARSLSNGRIGASLGPRDIGGQIVTVSGTLYASSQRGMAFGERWLYDVLAGGLCDDDPSLQVLPACGEAWRTVPHVALIDEPVYSPVVQDAPDCVLQAVAFQLGSECPWLLADPVPIFDGVSLSGATQNRLLSTDEWLGDAGLRITIESGPGVLSGLVISGNPTTDGLCPSGLPYCWSWTVTNLPGGALMIIDAVDRIVEARYILADQVIGGLDYLDYNGAFIMPDLAPCSQLCLKVEGGSGATLTVEQVGRVL